MINRILDWICPSRVELLKSELRLKELEEYTNGIVDELSISKQLTQKLADSIAQKKTITSTTIDKLSVTQHAIHRARERHDYKGTDEEISKRLYKALITQLGIMDTLPDGVYTLSKGVAGQVKDSTLLTVLPERASRPQTLKKKIKV